jgi:hypothetical protein
VAEIIPMGECAECRQLKTEVEKAALEYLRVTSFTDKDDKRNRAAREKVAEAQKRFNIHKKTHKKTRGSAAT